MIAAKQHKDGSFEFRRIVQGWVLADGEQAFDLSPGADWVWPIGEDSPRPKSAVEVQSTVLRAAWAKDAVRRNRSAAQKILAQPLSSSPTGPEIAAHEAALKTLLGA